MPNAGFTAASETNGHDGLTQSRKERRERRDAE